MATESGCMAENAYACCGSTEEQSETSTEEQPATDTEQSEASAGQSAADQTERWLGDTDGLDATLPADVQAALGRFFGTEPVETLGECAARFQEHFGGGATVEDLCSTDEETGHRATVGDETHHFRCFYDAVILAALEERPVDIRTESPDGTVIDARALGGEALEVEPVDAVFSFGLDDSGVEGEPTLEDGYAAICPYVKAFPNREAYQEWANTASAPTVGLPLAGATEFASALID
jgi:alkylmercury lyase